jgi:hypothetical protein
MNNIRLYTKEYLKNLSDVKTYIVYIQEQSMLFEKISYPDIDISGVDVNKMKQRFGDVLNTPVTYNAAIICLYGCYESYIDKVCGSLLDFLISKVKNYENLDESIKNKHIRKSGEFLSNPQRFRNFEISEQDVIEKLHTCVVKKENYSLNKDLLLTHSGNLGIDHLLELFRDLGLSNCKENILSNARYIEYISKKYELNFINAKKYIDKKNQESVNCLFEELGQLVEQRNKVAHGWCVDARLSYNVLTETIIPFMKILGLVIQDIFEDEFVKILYENNLLRKFDTIIDVYNKRILCVNCKDAKLKCNGFIYGKNGNRYVALKILDLQHDKESLEEICEENIEIGIFVDADIKKNWTFYYT